MRDVPVLSLTWRGGPFAHWPMDPSHVRPLVPDALDVDAREGTAWVSALPSLVETARPWLLSERADDPVVRHAPAAGFRVRTPFRGGTPRAGPN